jgi:hypothetical protein
MRVIYPLMVATPGSPRKPRRFKTTWLAAPLSALDARDGLRNLCAFSKLAWVR